MCPIISTLWQKVILVVQSFAELQLLNAGVLQQLAHNILEQNEFASNLDHDGITWLSEMVL